MFPYMESFQFPKEQINYERAPSVELVPISSIRVAEKQERKISWDRVERHRVKLEEGTEDLLPLDVHRLEDGTYIIGGNGRHRYFAYKEAGFKHIPINVKQNDGFVPTTEKSRTLH